MTKLKKNRKLENKHIDDDTSVELLKSARKTILLTNSSKHVMQFLTVITELI